MGTGTPPRGCLHITIRLLQHTQLSQAIIKKSSTQITYRRKLGFVSLNSTLHITAMDVGGAAAAAVAGAAPYLGALSTRQGVSEFNCMVDAMTVVSSLA